MPPEPAVAPAASCRTRLHAAQSSTATGPQFPSGRCAEPILRLALITLLAFTRRPSLAGWRFRIALRDRERDRRERRHGRAASAITVYSLVRCGNFAPAKRYPRQNLAGVI